jgi:hypothetical protein
VTRNWRICQRGPIQLQVHAAIHLTRLLLLLLLLVDTLTGMIRHHLTSTYLPGIAAAAGLLLQGHERRDGRHTCGQSLHLHDPQRTHQHGRRKHHSASTACRYLPTWLLLLLLLSRGMSGEMVDTLAGSHSIYMTQHQPVCLLLLLLLLLLVFVI